MVAVALLAAVCFGAGVYFVLRTPAFWGAVVGQIAAVLLPAIRQLIIKDMSPEETKEWHKAIRRGSDDEFQRKRRGAPPKG